MRPVFKGEKGKLIPAAAVVLFAAILFYELLEHFAAVREAASCCVNVAAPVIRGIALAYVLNLPMSLIENRFLKRLREKRPRLARAVSAGACYLLLIAGAALAVSLAVPRVTESVTMLLGSLGGYLSELTARLEAWSLGLGLSPEAYEAIDKVSARAMERADELAIGAVQRLPGMTASAVTVAGGLLVTLVISVHALIRKEKLLRFARRTLSALLPERLEAPFFRVCTLMNRTFKRYVTGQLTSCLILGALCYIGMRVLDLPYPELIALFIGAAALVPIIGPWVSTLLSALMIFVARIDEPQMALWFILLVLTIQLLDDNLITPRIVGDAVGLPGMLVLTAVIVAGGLFGIGGLLVAVPITAVGYKLLGEWVEKKQQETGKR